jgi:hypothetical protein
LLTARSDTGILNMLADNQLSSGQVFKKLSLRHN